MNITEQLTQRVNPKMEFFPNCFIPKESVETFEIFLIENKKRRLEENINDFPSSIDDFEGFQLVAWNKKTNDKKTDFNSSSNSDFSVVEVNSFEPSQLMDYPMLGIDYVEWSSSVWSQQSKHPLSLLASNWHEFVSSYDFDSSPSSERVNEYVETYRQYLLKAKDNGYTLLQPGSLVEKSFFFDWDSQAFAPLPIAIIKDSDHPWFKVFNKNYDNFRSGYLKPMIEIYMR